jgi:transketolase
MAMRSAPWRWTPCSRPIPATPARRWAWPRWRWRCGARHLRHNPANPHWADRDRFVLSNGHGSMLVYALLHLSGYDLPMSELRNFRQLHSKTPGHPEVDVTPGVETTTGPLGQGITNAVGMALAEKLLAHEFNRPGHAVVDHRTYVFLGDGCLMEGISHEACALAGAWKLNKLVALYDDNGISIDGQVAPWYVDDAAGRFKAYGWNVIGPVDGHDVDAVDAAMTQAKGSATQPTLIICKTTIGKGSPNRAGTAKAHGEPLGGDEIKLTRDGLGWPHEPFVIPEDAYAAWDAKAAGAAAEAAWADRFAAYQAALPRAGGRVRAPHEGRAAGRLRADRGRRRGRRAHQGRDGGQPQGQPDRARGLHQGHARAAGRIGRPHRLQPDQHQLTRRRCASTPTARPTAAATSTTACASSAWPRS